MAAATVVRESSPFNLTYNVQTPSNFGESYAQGIGQAGKSIADALGNVTSIMAQSQSVNDQIDMFSRLKDSQGNPLMSPEDRDALLSKGLAARQAFVGEIMGRWGESYKSQLAERSALAVEQARSASALTQQGAATAGSISLAQEKSRLDTEAEARKNAQQNITFTDSAAVKAAEAEKARRAMKQAQQTSQAGVLHQYGS